MRTPHGRFAEYHTSADDPSFIRPDHLARSLQSTIRESQPEVRAAARQTGFVSKHRRPS
jgi:aminopeptidase-like protein